MIVLINGSFGVGKTTVARLLVDRIPQSILFDPEIIGFVLRRLPRFVPLDGRGSDDYQDIALWRRLASLMPALLDKIGRRNVIVPMAFSNLDYLSQVRSGFARYAIPVHHFCLTASLTVVQSRLLNRGLDPNSAEGRWVFSKAAYCCRVHSAPEFAEHVMTDERLPEDIANDIQGRINFLEKGLGR
jgi:hypothetical protein